MKTFGIEEELNMIDKQFHAAKKYKFYTININHKAMYKL